MRFLLGYGSCGIASGAKNVLKGLEGAFENTTFTVEKVGCNGLCFAEPIVEVITDEDESILYGRLDEKSAKNKAEKELLALQNKQDAAAVALAAAQQAKKDVEAVLKSFIDVVSSELKKGGKIQLVGFGTFEVSERAAREGRNPQTGEVMKIAASKAPKFKAGKALKDMINA